MITTPNEIIDFCTKRKCPICKTNLLEDNITTWGSPPPYVSFYQSEVVCYEEDSHYILQLEYADPKKIEIASEILSLYDDKFKYEIILEDKKTHIRTIELDTSGSIIGVINGGRINEIGPFNDILFDVNKFNKKKWLERLQVFALLE